MVNELPVSAKPPERKPGHFERFLSSLLDIVSERIPGAKQAIEFIKGGVKEMTRTGWSFLALCILIIAVPSAVIFYYLGWHHGWTAYENFTGDALAKEVVVLSPSERGKKYEELFSDNKGNAMNLVIYGRSAFRAGDYDWAVKFYEESELHVWDDACRANYPFYPAALVLLKRQDEGHQKFKLMIRFIDEDISKNSGYLRYRVALGAISQNLSEARKLMPDSEKTYIDTIQEEVDQRIAEVEKGQD
ncbi:MAG TPA: hypothetical protein VN784_06310 [Candidatus Limnocylindrales bacterium]|nr:hypothetical protein [Candidatus Limnocylindrales bacterium]